jgi:outer membrane biosynthesis protein TonB
MTEGLFILTTIFVAYVVYAIIGAQKATAKSKAPTTKPEVQAAVVDQPKPQAAVATEKPAAIKPTAAKTVAPKTTATTKAETPKPAATQAAAPKVAAKPAATKTTTAAKKAAVVAVQSTGLKDPKTGEVATTYGNYRFAKRWIKEALVAEGLLEKIYTANELNAETDAKIKEAVSKLEAMDKYKA